MLGKASELDVSADGDGIPTSLTRKGRHVKVIRVYDRWRIADSWWADDIRREYFRLELGNGSVCDIYHDLAADRWYLTRSHG